MTTSVKRFASVAAPGRRSSGRPKMGAQEQLRRVKLGLDRVASDLERLKSYVGALKSGLATPSAYAGSLRLGLGRVMLRARGLRSGLGCVAEDLGSRKLVANSGRAALATLARELAVLKSDVAALRSDMKWVKAALDKIATRHLGA